MFTKTGKQLVVVSFLVFTALISFPSFLNATHSWGTVHWARTANPFTLKLGDNLSSDWDPYLATTSSDWSLSTVMDTTIVPGSTTGKRCRPKLGRIEVCNAKYGNNGWLGLAQIWLTEGEHITQATAKMNDTYFAVAPYNTAAWKQLVMCQEVGHDFGLAHVNEVNTNPNLGTCMDYTSDPDGPPSNEHPNAHDYDQLVTIYTHLDSSTTVGQTVPPAMNLLSFDKPTQWGKRIRQSPNGRVALYELDFGGGNKVLTLVTFAH